MAVEEFWPRLLHRIVLTGPQRPTKASQLSFKFGFWLSHPKFFILFLYSIERWTCWAVSGCCPAAFPIVLELLRPSLRMFTWRNFRQKSRSWSTLSNTLPPRYLTYCNLLLMLCYFYPSFNRTQTSWNFSFCFLSLEDHQDVSWQMWDEPMCCLWSAVVLWFFTCCLGSFCDLLAELSLS